MPVSEVPVRDAATVVLVRDGCDGLEVLLAERARSMRFGPGMHVFPGGAVDVRDRVLGTGPALGGLSAEQACRLVGGGGLAFWAAAIRECVEEAGVLLATGGAVDDDCIASVRAALVGGGADVAGVCATHGLVPAAERLHYLSHWITPPGPPRRFDTRFFIAAVAPDQSACADGNEITSCAWIRPEEALTRHAAQRLPMMLPTLRQLEFLCTFDTAAAAVAAVRAFDHVETVAPGSEAEARRKPH